MALETKEGSRRTVRRTLTLTLPADELYGAWRDFEGFPRFMDHVKSVRVEGDGRRSHWVVKAPAGVDVEWDAEITEDRPAERIAWRALPGADIPNEGEVSFAPAPGGRGTEVSVALTFEPPAGTAGELVARLFGEHPDQQLDEDMQRFRQLMVAGTIPTTCGQPQGTGKAGAEEEAAR